jgi:hypothetical protein
MVVQGDFTILLVNADGEEPFKEHTKDGEVYVEAEPGAEYFISVQRTGNATARDLVLNYFVDDADLEFETSFFGVLSASEPKLEGLWSRTNGVESRRALKFVAPPKRWGEGSARITGKVEIKVFEGVHPRELDCFDCFAPVPLTAAAVDLSQLVAGKGKRVRTGEGSTVVTTRATPQMVCDPGALVDTITLHYGSVPELIEAGVLRKPDDRMARPSLRGLTNKRCADGAAQPSKKARKPDESSGESDDESIDESDDGEPEKHSDAARLWLEAVCASLARKIVTDRRAKDLYKLIHGKAAEEDLLVHVGRYFGEGGTVPPPPGDDPRETDRLAAFLDAAALP